jgi:sulfite reductase alpha subunit-like flavoprotein/cytochrome b involved in lipid metabolism
VSLTSRPIPARLVLRNAAATNERLGHENYGSLSEECGFLPAETPLLSLPGSHHAWDEAAEQLPELVRTLRLREAVDVMPVLVAGKKDLPDRFLLRASVVLSMLAHAYHYVEPDPPDALPPAVAGPWEQVTRRLGRPARHLSSFDLAYNWRYVDARRPAEIRIENLQPLVPIVGNEGERRFLMATVEAIAATAPIVTSVVRMQEALICDDLRAARRELIAITDAIHAMTSVTFAKVNPNRYSSTYVDPVVWGKTVGPFTVPFEPGAPGSGGTAIPTFQLLDVVFGRRTYATTIGAETDKARLSLPVHWRAFLDAVGEIPIEDHVLETGDRLLRGVFREAFDAYAGSSGFLARHRTKTYGYLDLSFKTGRATTIAGFAGDLNDRVWDRTDDELEDARRERHMGDPERWHQAAIEEVRPLGHDDAVSGAHVVLDVAGSGLRLHPGGRCAVLPENDSDLVERTLRALHARGDELVALDGAWREAISARAGYETARILTLRTLLTFGRIRPVDRTVAKLLHTIEYDEWLARVVERRAEDQWELWDLLEELNSRGFDPKQLWKAHAGELGSICRVVPPERPRLYSISNVMENPDAQSAQEIHLTIAQLRYGTETTDVSVRRERQGTASAFLSRSASVGRRLPIRVIAPMRFAPPPDPSRPLVMFAAGTGLAPFASMLLQRSREPGAGRCCLFFVTRTRRDVYHDEVLAGLLAADVLDLHLVFSADDARLDDPAVQDGRLRFAAGKRQRIGDEMLAPDNARRLWELISKQGAVLYVCGQAGFAATVMDALSSILAQFTDGPPDQAGARARETLNRLIGEGRYLQEVYTTYTGAQHTDQRVIDASDVVLHNNDYDGYWVVIEGRTYDLTQFAAMHPGGAKIIHSYAGMDATDAYRKVLHDRNPEVHSMLAMNEIGVVRRLDFGSSWRIAIERSGLRVVTAKDLYRAWINLLYLAVEMENAVSNDYGVRSECLTHDERDRRPSQSRYKTQLLFQAHRRFLRDHLAALTGEPLEHLWSLTSAPHASHHDVSRMRLLVTAIRRGDTARRAAQLDEDVAAALRARRDLSWCVESCERLESADRKFLRDLKLGLRAGVQVFERWERDTLRDGAAELLDAVVALPTALEHYFVSLGGPP